MNTICTSEILLSNWGVALIAQSPGQHSCSSSAQQFEFCKCCKVWQGLHWRRSTGGHWTWRKPVAMQCELATSSINISIVFPPCSERVWTMLSQTGNRFRSRRNLIWESSILMLRLWNNLHFQRVAKEIRWCVTNQTKKIGIHLTMTSRLLHHELYLLPDCVTPFAWVHWAYLCQICPIGKKVAICKPNYWEQNINDLLIPVVPMVLKRVCHTWIQASNLEGERIKLRLN